MCVVRALGLQLFFGTHLHTHMQISWARLSRTFSLFLSVGNSCARASVCLSVLGSQMYKLAGSQISSSGNLGIRVNKFKIHNLNICVYEFLLLQFTQSLK